MTLVSGGGKGNFCFGDSYKLRFRTRGRSDNRQEKPAKTCCVEWRVAVRRVTKVHNVEGEEEEEEEESFDNEPGLRQKKVQSRLSDSFDLWSTCSPLRRHTHPKLLLAYDSGSPPKQPRANHGVIREGGPPDQKTPAFPHRCVFVGRSFFFLRSERERERERTGGGCVAISLEPHWLARLFVLVPGENGRARVGAIPSSALSCKAGFLSRCLPLQSVC